MSKLTPALEETTDTPFGESDPSTEGLADVARNVWIPSAGAENFISTRPPEPQNPFPLTPLQIVEQSSSAKDQHDVDSSAPELCALVWPYGDRRYSSAINYFEKIKRGNPELADGLRDVIKDMEKLINAGKAGEKELADVGKSLARQFDKFSKEGFSYNQFSEALEGALLTSKPQMWHCRYHEGYMDISKLQSSDGMLTGTASNRKLLLRIPIKFRESL